MDVGIQTPRLRQLIIRLSPLTPAGSPAIVDAMTYRGRKLGYPKRDGKDCRVGSSGLSSHPVRAQEDAGKKSKRIEGPNDDKMPCRFRDRARKHLAFLLLSSVAAGAPLLAGAAGPAGDSGNDGANLIKIVRENTRQYADVNVATADGYAPFLGCVTGPDHGAMGFITLTATCSTGHLTRTSASADLRAYGRKMRLVGVEFIV